MAVSVKTLWGSSKFIDLSVFAKILYIYLVTNPSLNSVGVLLTKIPLMLIHLRMSEQDLRKASRELINKQYIFIKKHKGEIYFIVPQHFSSLPKSDSSIMKVNRDLQSLPEPISDFLQSIGVRNEAKLSVMDIPTEEEILEFVISEGYNINPKQVKEHYERNAKNRGLSGVWVNSKGRKVKDWKATLRKVWFRDENKLKSAPDAPKGFEFFNVKLNGNVFYPSKWVGGKPKHSNFLVSKKLNEEFNKNILKNG